MEFINKKYKLFASPSPKEQPRNCKNQKKGAEDCLLGMAAWRGLFIYQLTAAVITGLTPVTRWDPSNLCHKWGRSS